MVTSELIEYVKNERARGVADDVLRLTLQTSGGWALIDIEEALRISAAPLTPVGGVQSIINATNAAPAKTGIDPVLKNFRNQRKWLIFSVQAAAVLLWVVLSAIESTDFISLVWVPLVVLILLYCVSALISKITRPLGSPTKDVFMLIFLIFSSLAISFLIAGGLFFATCLIIVSGNGGF